MRSNLGEKDACYTVVSGIWDMHLHEGRNERDSALRHGEGLVSYQRHTSHRSRHQQLLMATHYVLIDWFWPVPPDWLFMPGDCVWQPSLITILQVTWFPNFANGSSSLITWLTHIKWLICFHGSMGRFFPEGFSSKHNYISLAIPTAKHGLQFIGLGFKWVQHLW